MSEFVSTFGYDVDDLILARIWARNEIGWNEVSPSSGGAATDAKVESVPEAMPAPSYDPETS